MLRFKLNLSAFLLLVFGFSGFATAKSSGKLNYTVDIREGTSHRVHVTLKPEGLSAKTATFQMPVWAPGAYSVTHYGKYVVNFKAQNRSGKDLPIQQLNSDRWEIQNA